MALYFDDVKMAGIPVKIKNIDSNKITLSAHLSRDSNDANSRDSWDEFLGKQKKGYLMSPTLGLSINGAIPVEVIPSNEQTDATGAVTQVNSSDQSFTFCIAPPNKIWQTLITGILIFLDL